MHRVQSCAQGLGHTPQPGTIGHRTPRGLTVACLGEEGVSASSLARIDRQTEGMIHVSGGGLRAKNRERFDVRMRAGRCSGGSCQELWLLEAFPLPKPALPTLPRGPGLAWWQQTTEATWGQTHALK